MKLLIILICIIGLSCSHIKLEGWIKPNIRNIYLSSITIKDCDGDYYGSGTIIYNKKGHQMIVLTAAHVIIGIKEKKKEICFNTAFDYKTRFTTIYKIDIKTDLAILHGKNKEERSGPSVNISLHIPDIGDQVVVIGSPMGEERTVTSGIISGFKVRKKKVLYKTTASIFYGSSGGGMFNSDGELIGVAHKILDIQRTIFYTQIVPGGFFFIGLETIRNFI